MNIEPFLQEALHVSGAAFVVSVLADRAAKYVKARKKPDYSGIFIHPDHLSRPTPVLDWLERLFAKNEQAAGKTSPPHPVQTKKKQQAEVSLK